MAFEASHQIKIPQEIIDNVINCLIPSGNPIALPQSHPVTKTLLNLTRSSRVTYPEAAKLLYAHCLYIDSPERLHRLSSTVSAMAGQQPSHSIDVPLVHCFSSQPNPRPNAALLKVGSSSIDESNNSTIPNEKSSSAVVRLSTLPPFSAHKHTTSLYLEPFPREQETLGGIEDLAIAHSIHDLISLVAPTLKRLVIDINFGKTPFGFTDAFGIFISLRDAFVRCTSIEFLCSIQSYFYLDIWFGDPMRHRGRGYSPMPPVWYKWTNLNTIIMNSNHIGERIWGFLRACAKAETLVMVQPRGMHYDLKEIWRKEGRTSPCGSNDPERPLSVFLVDVEGGHIRPQLLTKSAWVQDEITVRMINVKYPFNGTLPAVLCQEQVKRWAMTGEAPLLWK